MIEGKVSHIEELFDDLLPAIDDIRALWYDCLGRSGEGILFSAQITN